MKNNFLLFIALIALLAIVACNRKSGTTTQQGKPEVNTTAEPGIDSAEGESAGDAYQYAGFQKTPCFGKCPVYEVKFYSDGKVTWYGRMNVERMGWYEAQVDQRVLKSIKTKAEEMDYFSFYNEYPVGTKVPDLPTTITYLRIGDMEKQVRNTHEAPEKLQEFEKYLEELISGLDWRPSK